jgi:hypothetical protein
VAVGVVQEVRQGASSSSSNSVVVNINSSSSSSSIHKPVQEGRYTSSRDLGSQQPLEACSSSNSQVRGKGRKV